MARASPSWAPLKEDKGANAPRGPRWLTPATVLAGASLGAVLLLGAWVWAGYATAATGGGAFVPLEEVRWGIVGCGDVTEKKSGPAFALVPGSKLVMVMRRNASLAEDYARRHNVPRWTSNAEELINDPEVNAVYVATPPRFHVQYALMAAAAGKPAYVEKPMGVSYEDGKAAVQTFRAKGLPLFVAYYRRALPNFLQVKQLIDSGAIGAVRAVTVVYHRPANANDQRWAQASREAELQAGASLADPTLKWRPDPAVGGAGGYFRDKGSHQLDLLQYWLGPIVSVSGQATNQEHLYPSPDSVAAQFKFASGVVGTGSWCFVAGKSAQQEYGEVAGTGGRIRFQFFLSNKVELWNSSGSFQFEVPNPAHVQQPLIHSVVDALRGQGECPSTGETALSTSLLMDTIVKGSSWP